MICAQQKEKIVNIVTKKNHFESVCSKKIKAQCNQNKTKISMSRNVMHVVAAENEMYPMPFYKQQKIELPSILKTT